MREFPAKFPRHITNKITRLLMATWVGIWPVGSTQASVNIATEAMPYETLSNLTGRIDKVQSLLENLDQRTLLSATAYHNIKRYLTDPDFKNYILDNLADERVKKLLTDLYVTINTQESKDFFTYLYSRIKTQIQNIEDFNKLPPALRAFVIVSDFNHLELTPDSALKLYEQILLDDPSLIERLFIGMLRPYDNTDKNKNTQVNLTNFVQSDTFKKSLFKLAKDYPNRFWEFALKLDAMFFVLDSKQRKLIEHFRDIVLSNADRLRGSIISTDGKTLNRTFISFLYSSAFEEDKALRELAYSLFESIPTEGIKEILLHDKFFIKQLPNLDSDVQKYVWIDSISRDEFIELMQKKPALADVFLKSIYFQQGTWFLFDTLSQEQLISIIKHARTPIFWELLFKNEKFRSRVFPALIQMPFEDMENFLRNDSFAFFYNYYDLKNKENKNNTLEKYTDSFMDYIRESEDVGLTGFGSMQLNLLVSDIDFWEKALGRQFFLSTVKFAASNDALSAARKITEKFAEKDRVDVKQALLSGIFKFVSNTFSDRNTAVSDEEYNKLMRIINTFHAHENTKWRKEIVGMLNAEHKYKLSVFGMSEIFTSTSSYVRYILPTIFEDIKRAGDFNKYMSKVDPQFLHLSKFIVVISNYDRLDVFLKVAKLDGGSNLNKMLDALFSGDVTVSVAQALIKLAKFYIDKMNSEALKLLEAELFKQLKIRFGSDRLKAESLISLYFSLSHGKVQNSALQDEFKILAQKHNFKIPNTISFDELYHKEEDLQVFRQIQFFVEGGDKDGIKSRQSAYESLKKAGFKLKVIKPDTRFGQQTNSDLESIDKYAGYTYIFYKQFGAKRVEVLLSPILPVNKLQAADEYELKAMLGPVLRGYLGNNKTRKVSALFYRGHSTYVPDFARLVTLFANATNNSLAMINLGSCGGTMSIEKIMSSLKGNVSAWIATEGTGSTSINDPLNLALLENILSLKVGESLDFERLKGHLSHLNKYREYDSYKFPHENFPAILSTYFKKLNQKY